MLGTRLRESAGPTGAQEVGLLTTGAPGLPTPLPGSSSSSPPGVHGEKVSP